MHCSDMRRYSTSAPSRAAARSENVMPCIPHFVAELESNRSGTPGFRVRLAWAISGLLEARIYAQSDLVHCFSHYRLGELGEKYERFLSGKYNVLPVWVNSNRFRPSLETRQRVRERLGSPWRPQVTTFFPVRRLVPRMGLDTLLEAAAILSKEGSQFWVGHRGRRRTTPGIKSSMFRSVLGGPGRLFGTDSRGPIGGRISRGRLLCVAYTLSGRIWTNNP